MREASPFKCETCTERDKDARNCFNHKGLSDDARAVGEYTEEVKGELKERGGEKVFSLGDVRLYECPFSLITRETQELIRLCFLVEETGQLLFNGGWAEQPYWLIEAFEIYKMEIGLWQAKEKL